MADDHDSRDSPDDLYPFAQALVRKLLKKKGLTWDSHRVEDAEQDLFPCAADSSTTDGGRSPSHGLRLRNRHDR